MPGDPCTWDIATPKDNALLAPTDGLAEGVARLGVDPRLDNELPLAGVRTTLEGVPCFARSRRLRGLEVCSLIP